MTHLCYSLDEAAQRLDMSETVLVRLSQYFKVPQSAYEELGYLSFKGDLLFSDQDIDFFRRVKEHLLAGESLESVKGRVQESRVQEPEGKPSFLDAVRRVNPETLDGQTLVSPSPARPDPAGVRETPPPSVDAPVRIERPVAAAPPVSLRAVDPPMQEIMAPEAAKQVAEENFERYRGKRRPREAKVFENMIREVGNSPSEKSFSSLPFTKALKPKVEENLDEAAQMVRAESPKMESLKTERPVRLQPIGLAQTREIEFDRLQSQSAEVASVLNERFPWKSHLQAARQHPRILDERLRQAARLIREQAIR